MRKRTLALLAVIALLAAGCATGGTTDAAGGPNETVTVHGSWTIDVLNSDGTVAEHRTFHNDLLPAGEEMLALLLARQATTGGWRVFLDNGAENAPCPSFCRIGEAGVPSALESDNLVVTVENTSTVRLSGSVAATQDGQITAVASDPFLCQPSVAPSDCLGESGVGPSGAFTNTILAPIDVALGQIVQVQVDISFATG